MKCSSGPRTTASLSESIHRQLNMYTLAASAAGVSVLALAQPSEAKIIYTPAHVKILPNTNFNLDLNHDGIVDVAIYNTYQGASHWAALWAVVGGIEEVSFFPWSQYALTLGARIGPAKNFGNRGMMLGYYGEGSCHGRWGNVNNRYLGLRFQGLGGKTHYGWARLTVRTRERCTSKIFATLTGYAYETIADKPIIAGRTKEQDDSANEDFGADASLTAPGPSQPQPAILGALAMGAPGLSIWRREESLGATAI